MNYTISRGSTPTLTFNLPFDADNLATAYVTIKQRDDVVVEKELQDCRCESRKLLVRLTQEETLALCCDCTARIQVRTKAVDGTEINSPIYEVLVGEVLKEGVI